MVWFDRGGGPLERTGGTTEITHVATGGSHTFTVPPLVAGLSVRAKHADGTRFTPWSPAVIVEDAAVPPQSGPGLPESEGVCNRWVWAGGLVPGCEVRV